MIKVALPGSVLNHKILEQHQVIKLQIYQKNNQSIQLKPAQTVITEEPEKRESLLPNKSPDEQYEFAVSFMKIGDYETAEFALKEFIDKNKDHDLAGSAQYWYGETFRIRQLYSDAATAYLDGYQNYP